LKKKEYKRSMGRKLEERERVKRLYFLFGFKTIPQRNNSPASSKKELRGMLNTTKARAHKPQGPTEHLIGREGNWGIPGALRSLEDNHSLHVQSG